MIPLIVHGIDGRMGRRIAALAASDAALTLVAGIERRGHPAIGGSLFEAPVFDDFDKAACVAEGAAPGERAVVIDFSSPGALALLAPLAASRGVAVVSGTTGLDTAAEAALTGAAARVAVVWAPNMSLGVNLLFRLCAEAARALGAAADIEIVEAHHRHKKDAPSGTAQRLFEVVSAARGGLSAVHGREGLGPGDRPRGEVGMHSLRLGEIPGDHEIHFALDHEVVTLHHRALGRDAFASGALVAARFAASAPPGRYGMEAVLA